LQQQQKFIALAMATQREILDACMNDEPRQKLNEKKKHKFKPKIRSRDSQKKKFKTGTKPSVARFSTGKKKHKNRPSAAKHLPTFRKNKNEAVDDYNQTAAKST
jgi:hypothetical protein